MKMTNLNISDVIITTKSFTYPVSDSNKEIYVEKDSIFIVVNIEKESGTKTVNLNSGMYKNIYERITYTLLGADNVVIWKPNWLSIAEYATFASGAKILDNHYTAGMGVVSNA